MGKYYTGKEIIMTLEEIREFIDENKEDEGLKSLLKEYAVRPSKEEILKDPEIKSELDRRISKAVDAHDKEKVPELVHKRLQEELEKEDNPLKAEVKNIREELNSWKHKAEEAERQRKREEIKNKAQQKISEKGLPSDIIDFLITDDEESTDSNLSRFEESITKYADKIKKGVYDGKNTDVPGKETSTSPSGEPGPNATKEEWKKYLSKQ